MQKYFILSPALKCRATKHHHFVMNIKQFINNYLYIQILNIDKFIITEKRYSLVVSHFNVGVSYQQTITPQSGVVKSIPYSIISAIG